MVSFVAGDGTGTNREFPMAENKQIAFRLAPDMQSKLEELQELHRWTPGQAVAELLAWRERMNAALRGVGIGVQPDGERLIFRKVVDEYGEDIDVVEGTYELLVYLIEELREPVNIGFRREPKWENIV